MLFPLQKQISDGGVQTSSRLSCVQENGQPGSNDREATTQLPLPPLSLRTLERIGHLDFAGEIGARTLAC